MDYLISMEKVNHFFGKKQVLKDINLQVPGGCIYGLLGPSGGGKSTMVRIMAGILTGGEGQTLLLSKPMPDLTVSARIGYMAQGDALYPALSAEENLLFFGALYHMDKQELKGRIGEVLELVGLASERQKQVCNFSGGMKRRLSLAAALLHRPEVLILDEPTVGIDPVLRKSIWNRLSQLAGQGTAILVTTHVMDEAEKCDRLAMLREGSIIAEGTPAGLMQQCRAQTLEEAFLMYEGGEETL